MIPGSNLLNTALKVIARQLVTYHKYKQTVQNEAGLDVSVYQFPVNITGSWQPVPRRLYQNLGLDFNNYYVNFFTSANVQDVQRDTPGDQVTYCGDRYQVISATPWTQIDGWTDVLCCKIGDKNAR